MHVSKVFKRQLGSAAYRDDRRQARQRLREAGIYERITVWERPKADLDEDMSNFIYKLANCQHFLSKLANCQHFISKLA